MAGKQTVTRRVKNKGSSAATYTVAHSLPGVAVSVSTARFTIQPSQEKSFTVSSARTTAPFGSYTRGSLTWRDQTHRVRIPLAVRPVALKAPAEVHGAASASGSQAYSVIPGSSGILTSTVNGLTGVTPTQSSVTSGSFDPNAPVVDADPKEFSVSVPTGR